MATVDDQRPTLLSATHTPRRCASPSSSTESFNTINSGHGALIERLGRLALQPKLNGKLQHGKQLAKAANCSIRKLLCGFAHGTQDDTLPLIELSSMTRADAERCEAVYAANDALHRSYGDAAKKVEHSRHSVALRKSNSTSTVNALNLDLDQQRVHQDRPSCIYLRSSSAAAPKRADTLAPKPSPATTDSHGQAEAAPDLEDNVPYVSAQPAGDFVAPAEPLGSLIKALYAMVKNPEQADAESRSKKVKLHLRVTIHPEGHPDTPQSTTSGSSNKAVAERGHRWSRSGAHAHAHPVTLHYAYPPGSYRTSRLRTRKCRHQVAHRKRLPATTQGRGHFSTSHNEYAYVRYAVPLKLPAQMLAHRAPRHSDANPAARLDRELLRVQDEQDGRQRPIGRDCRHSGYGNNLVYHALGTLPAVNRIQHVVDWLHNEENDFGASWANCQSALVPVPDTVGIAERKSTHQHQHQHQHHANGRRKTRECDSNSTYAQMAKTAQDVVRVMAQWELQVQRLEKPTLCPVSYIPDQL